jgi:hypothetical protein
VFGRRLSLAASAATSGTGQVEKWAPRVHGRGAFHFNDFPHNLRKAILVLLG